MKGNDVATLVYDAANTNWEVFLSDGTGGVETVTGTAVYNTDPKNPVVNLPTRHIEPFDANASWDAPAGGLYTIVIPVATHGITAPLIVQAYLNDSGDFILADPQELKILANGDVSISVSEVGDGRFAGPSVTAPVGTDIGQQDFALGTLQVTAGDLINFQTQSAASTGGPCVASVLFERIA